MATGSGTSRSWPRSAARTSPASTSRRSCSTPRGAGRAEAGVECEWVEGDAEELPYADDSFDRVLSAFGTMFAPRHEQAAAELVRVCRPGGTIAVAAWTPEGGNGQMFKTVARTCPRPRRS